LRGRSGVLPTIAEKCRASLSSPRIFSHRPCDLFEQVASWIPPASSAASALRTLGGRAGPPTLRSCDQVYGTPQSPLPNQVTVGPRLRPASRKHPVNDRPGQSSTVDQRSVEIEDDVASMHEITAHP